jgi:uncharacterized protein (TIGR02996 family)
VTAGEALYETILAAPADDLPRLVYADWLEEHGDAERAEFIRVQIDLARLPPSDPRRPTLRRREHDLLDRHKPAWSIPRLRGGQNLIRGFVGEVWAAAQDVVTFADALARVPLQSLRLTAAADWIQALVDRPFLAKLTSLDLSNNTGIHRRFDRLFLNGGLRSLSTLVLRNVRVWGEDLPRWPLVAGFPKLTHLDLSGNPLGDGGLGVLVEHPWYASLRSVTLRGDGQELYDLIRDEGLARLARSPNAGRLVRLDLSDNGIGDAGVEALATTDRFGDLKELNLSGNPIGPAGAAALARWPQLSTIDSIDLRKCEQSGEIRRQIRTSPWADKFILDEPIALV